jgi:hypothetical protein
MTKVKSLEEYLEGLLGDLPLSVAGFFNAFAHRQLSSFIIIIIISIIINCYINLIFCLNTLMFLYYYLS